MIQINEFFGQITDKLVANSTQSQDVHSKGVFQPANMKNRQLVETIVEKLVLPGSSIQGFEHLTDLYDRALAGKSCLLMLEHYSNFDIPCFFYLAKQHERGEELTNAIVAMAGHKLNAESRFVLAFTEAYTRIVIYPARTLKSLEGSPRYDEELRISREINRNALREMIRVKHSGQMVLVFPAGTRYRPGKPESRRVLREMDGYIKGFDYVVFVGIAGNTLEVNPHGDMAQDLAKQDVMTYVVSAPRDCRVFRDTARLGCPDGGEEAKQAVADAIERALEDLHQTAEACRKPIIEALVAEGLRPWHMGGAQKANRN